MRTSYPPALAAVCLALTLSLIPMGGPAQAATPIVSVPILMYHHIGNPAGHAGNNEFYVAPAAFEAQMAYLDENGFTPVSLEQVLAALQGEAPLPPQPVAVTFDDGNQDNYDQALPVLEKHHLTATFLIVTGWVGKPGRLTWDEIAAMQRAGMHFGAHTVSHPYLPTLPLAMATEEITQSKTDLEAHLGQSVSVFAYPYGRTDLAVTRLVQRAGFGVALGTSPYRLEHTQADRFFLTRFGVYSWTSLTSFKAQLPEPVQSGSATSGLLAVLRRLWALWNFP
jgi:peptidoglycan/xylan/chitin deacetylase (PgdA/CDA1 family)